MTRAFVAARSPVVRAGLESVLQRHGIQVVGSGSTAEAPPDADVMLIDLDGLSEEQFAGPGPPVVALTESISLDVLRGNLRGLLPKGAAEEEIAASVQAAAAGLITIHADFSELLQGARPAAAREGPLTPREVEVLRMIAEGLANKTIAWKLGISEHTVKFHITSIFGKLNVGTRTEAVTAGIRQGLVLL